MDSSIAQRLFDNGAVAVFLDVPSQTEFGIDMHSWRVGDKFKGVKMIPPGLHLVHYSAVNNEEVAPRSGFYHFFKPEEFLVRVWNPSVEDFEEPPDVTLLERLKFNKYELDRFLGAYPHESWKKWHSLTSHISEECVQRLQPAKVLFHSVAELECAEPSKTAGERAHCTLDSSNLPKMHRIEGTAFRFSEIPRDRFPVSASAADKTKYSLDSSYILDQLLDHMLHPDELLAELQLAFVTFLVGHVYDAFEHWKRLVALLCSCDDALRKHTALFLKFIACFHFQIREVPDSFFVDIVSKENFLVHNLYVFFSNVSDCTVPVALRQKGLDFKSHLERKFSWDFSSEPDEFAPVVVHVS